MIQTTLQSSLYNNTTHASHLAGNITYTLQNVNDSHFDFPHKFGKTAYYNNNNHSFFFHCIFSSIVSFSSKCTQLYPDFLHS